MHKFFALVACLFLLNVATVSAQRSDVNSGSSFTDRLWYGGGFILGFAGVGNESQFQFGVSPMVGYKLFDQFSVGPRVALTYTHYRINLGGGEVETANPITYALGFFGRLKIMPTIFAHAEYELENAANFFIGPGGLEIARRQRDNVYLGGGFNSGGRWASEILLLYNVNLPDNAIDQPFVLRFGFTRNF